MSDSMLLGALGQTVSDILGYEGNRHGATTKMAGKLDVLGYGFCPVAPDSAMEASADPSFDQILRPPTPGMNIG